jgi:hypothetical protein
MMKAQKQSIISIAGILLAGAIALGALFASCGNMYANLLGEDKPSAASGGGGQQA